MEEEEAAADEAEDEPVWLPLFPFSTPFERRPLASEPLATAVLAEADEADPPFMITG